MRILLPFYRIETPLTPEFRQSTLNLLEAATRTCYKSEDCATDDSAAPFVRKIAQVLKHRSVIEHVSVSVRFVCDRGVTHELVRHRLCAFSQESTRYCNYSKDKFGNQISCILPVRFMSKIGGRWSGEIPDAVIADLFKLEGERFDAWREAMKDAESNYFRSLELGDSPQEARGVLPTDLKTEIVCTANLREWHHIFTMRTAKAAHPHIRHLMIPLLKEFKAWMPEIYDDIEVHQ